MRFRFLGILEHLSDEIFSYFSFFTAVSLFSIFLISHIPSEPLAGQFHSDDPNHCLVNVVVPVLIIEDIVIILSLIWPCDYFQLVSSRLLLLYNKTFL